ncbi:bifunctional metallophosphatase/5'-nucleotidase [Paenibacillus soyae]|uniref:Bifunctional metallophosphatase/5'-nucleotidase n=1 Tax=Paenibacillus soyae TaxID=2969249 RepID=A0A9X2S8A7_9BACL|nr:bifunctional UDP-sugar hydrolase/5'-nucleotidase [Paenibacillus soyae]MCR2804154.1 bifunctional metallophosphatase/5'-nucleotidase [Paenibacillus soyae]
MTATHSATVTIWSTSDLHGFRCTPSQHPLMTNVHRMNELSRMILQSKQSLGRRFFWFDNGDAYQGAPLTDSFMNELKKGEDRRHPTTEWFRQTGCDAFVPGNHEFNYGRDAAQKIAGQSPIPWLSANIVEALTGEPLFGTPYRVWTTEEGVRVALLGLTTAFIPAWERPEHIEGLQFLSAVETAKRWVPLLREKHAADIVIVSYHGGFESNLEDGTPAEPFTGENEGYRLCTEVRGIDVLLTGHQHRLIGDARVDRTLVVQPGSYGTHVGEATLELTKREGSGWTVTSGATRLVSVEAAAVSPSPAWLQPYEEEVTRRLNRPLGQMTGDMRIRDAGEARRKKHPFVQWLNEAQMQAAGVDASLTALMDDNAPGFAPVVTERDIAANYPYPNTLAVLRLTGRQVKDALERSASYFTLDESGALTVSAEFQAPKSQPYNYDMWEGIEYVMDISRPPGCRVTKLTYKDRPLEPEQKLDVVMNHYRAGGGGGYSMFEDAPIVKQIHTEVAEILAEFMCAKPEWHVQLTENWKIIGARKD